VIRVGVRDRSPGVPLAEVIMAGWASGLVNWI
jgi:hypothetical protein